jgi:hypothetical protein
VAVTATACPCWPSLSGPPQSQGGWGEGAYPGDAMGYSFAPFNDTRALAELDQILGIHARSSLIGTAGNQQIDGTGKHLVGAIRII